MVLAFKYLKVPLKTNGYIKTNRQTNKNKTKNKSQQKGKTDSVSLSYLFRLFFFLISYYVANVIGCSWFHDLPIRYHSLFLWSRSPLHTVVLCTLIWSIPEKVAQSLSENGPKQCTPKSIMPRQQAWWYRSTIWREKRKANISELCSFSILKIISRRT